MELLLGFLRNPKYNIRPVWKLIQDHVVTLSRAIEWGPLPPYIIAGQLNQHPRAAIAWLATAQRDACMDFYDRTIADI
jgi:4-hydroxy 2-oxovalerate aldolase